MKRLYLLIALLTFTFTFAQKEQPPLEEQVKTYVLGVADSLQQEDGIIMTTVNGVKQVPSILEKAYDTAVPVVTDAVELVLEEGGILIKQFLWFKAIEALIPILFGILLLVIFFRYFPKWFAVTKQEAEEIDALYIKNNENNLYRVEPQTSTTKLFGLYFRNYNYVMTYIVVGIPCLIASLFAITGTFMTFIKITFFPKLYLFELVMQYFS